MQRVSAKEESQNNATDDNPVPSESLEPMLGKEGNEELDGDYSHDEIVDEIKEILDSGEWESAREVSAMTHEDEPAEKVAEAENFDLVQSIVDGKLPVFGDGIMDATKEDPIHQPIMVCLETAISNVVFG